MNGIQREAHAQEGMELQGQGRGLCISFSWLVNDKTLIGETVASSEALQMSQGRHFSRNAMQSYRICSQLKLRQCCCGHGAGLQREYDANGALLEVRSRTAILGSWAGGRM